MNPTFWMTTLFYTDSMKDLSHTVNGSRQCSGRFGPRVTNKLIAVFGFKLLTFAREGPINIHVSQKSVKTNVVTFNSKLFLIEHFVVSSIQNAAANGQQYT